MVQHLTGKVTYYVYVFKTMYSVYEEYHNTTICTYYVHIVILTIYYNKSHF